VNHSLSFFRSAAALLALAFAPSVFAAEPAPTASQRNYEIRFLTEMIDHHAMAVMMAELCLERAVHEELRATCEEIRETQMEEIATMQTWLADWYGLEHEPEMTAGMQKQLEKLAALSGAEFEIEFMETMIKHHRKAVVRARQCQDRAYHEELIAMCEQIETTQVAEIQQMSDWLCEWYDICRGPRE
jgi:uncharacterized protein (DUF305 family)